MLFRGHHLVILDDGSLSKLRVTDGYVINSSSTHPLRSLRTSGELSSVTIATRSQLMIVTFMYFTHFQVLHANINPVACCLSLSVVVFICNNMLSLAACVLSSESGSALSVSSGRAGTGTCYHGEWSGSQEMALLHWSAHLYTALLTPGER